MTKKEMIEAEFDYLRFEEYCAERGYLCKSFESYLKDKERQQSIKEEE
ncbi:hypothetical protein LCGC14_1248700 [marine sediment metagenome]|uniref:Uncharacterized protein n=1 Tax=marine sediment metagenome TaxID=412755 RepID=A0A0F9P7N9_9ZZZZ